MSPSGGTELQGGPIIRQIEDVDIEWISRLNKSLEIELSPLTPHELRQLIGRAFYAHAINAADAFLLAFDEGAPYTSPNFQWFRQRYQRFVYVDRIAVAPHARGRGLAATLYEDLQIKAQAADSEQLVCEVNIDPPNPASDRFHTKRGFAEVGRNRLKNGKYVRYLAKPV